LGKEWFDLAQNREGVAGFWEYGAERTCLWNVGKCVSTWGYVRFSSKTLLFPFG
jgi:hypothetical protein